MKLKQLVRLLLSVLFLLVSQSYAMHSGKHAFKKVEECYVCQSSEHSDTKHHEIHLPSFFVSHTSESVELEQYNVKNKAIDLKQYVVQKPIDIVGMKHLEVCELPLGFDTTAPPYSLS